MNIDTIKYDRPWEGSEVKIIQNSEGTSIECTELHFREALVKNILLLLPTSSLTWAFKEDTIKQLVDKAVRDGYHKTSYELKAEILTELRKR